MCRHASRLKTCKESATRRDLRPFFYYNGESSRKVKLILLLLSIEIARARRAKQNERERKKRRRAAQTEGEHRVSERKRVRVCFCCRVTNGLRDKENQTRFQLRASHLIYLPLLSTYARTFPNDAICRRQINK